MVSQKLWLVAPVLAILLSSCVSDPAALTGGDSKTVTSVAEKAIQVASLIGGPTGFGGMNMNGYMQAAPANMGFNSDGDLATPGSMMTVDLHNQTGQVCTFHLAYFSSQATPNEQTQDVTVQPGQTGSVQIPCSEIVGLGSLESTQAIGCTLADGQSITNMMAVPGFLHMDYNCGSMYEMYIGPDSNNLTGTGDTSALITMSSAMQAHMQSMMGGSTNWSGMMGGGMMGRKTP